MERINTPSPLPLAYQTRFQILHLKNQKQRRVLKCQFDCLILKETFLQQQNNVAYIVFTYQWKAYLSTSSFPFPTFIVCGILLFKTNPSFRFLLLILFLNDSKLNQSRKKKKETFFNLELSPISRISFFLSTSKCSQFCKLAETVSYLQACARAVLSTQMPSPLWFTLKTWFRCHLTQEDTSSAVPPILT